MKKVIALISLFLLILALSGCGTMERLLQDKGKDTFSSLLGSNLPADTERAVVGETISVTVYFADSAGKNLVPQEKLIPKTLSLARETLNELFKGPDQGSGLLPIAPSNTTLLDINIKNEIATVDLSQEIQKPVTKVSSELTVAAIVNTLTQFPTVKQVRFRVEGKDVQKIGSTNITQALSRNTSTVKTHPVTQKPVSGSGSL